MIMAQKKDKRVRVQVVDFFSGCGGMSFGFASAKTRNVHYDICGAVDFDPHANATYERMLGVTPITQDVRTLLPRREWNKVVSHWSLNKAAPLVVIGCAPCQGFSSHRKKDARTDERNSLLETFGTIVTRLLPDMVIMENVPEMLNERYWDHFEKWKSLMAKAGYKIRTRIYNLAQFGVPQERFRVLVVASRRWRYFSMPQPTYAPHQFVTVRQAIERLSPLEAGGVDPSDPMHITSRHRRETIELIRLIPPDGGSRRSLPANIGPKCLRKVDGFRDVYGRLAWDKPSVAITARCRTPSCGRYTHPVQHRGLSVREAALLQGFPDTYHFEGPFDDKYKQIGNAVSPIFSRSIAEHFDREWHSDHDSLSRETDAFSDIGSPITKSFSSAIASIKRRMRQPDAQHGIRFW
jgi:DNA (cytosine-5)-methyltransferase 1